MLPIADSLSRAGSRRMSIACVPITWLRNTAVSALAWLTIACTSARGATPRFLATRVARADPRDVAVAHHQLRHRVAAAGVDALDHRDVADDGVGDAMRVSGEDEVDRRVLQLVRRCR